MLLDNDADHHLVEVPDIVPARLLALHAADIVSAKLPAQAANGLVRDCNPALKQHFFGAIPST